MVFTSQSIPEVVLIEPQVFRDGRGFFMETYHQSKFEDEGIAQVFVQDNHSKSAKGVLRGLHYQTHQAQGKLVRVVRGKIYDVAVDLRKTSARFGAWVGLVLSAKNKNQLWIPPGFAHGFLALSENTEVIYKCTDFYAPQYERTLLWNDPDIGIDWPLELIGEPVLSEKDRQGISLSNAEVYE